jgi:hypothetical protein
MTPGRTCSGGIPSAKALAETQIGDTFNQYTGSALRRERLVSYLNRRADARYLLVGEAAGYRGPVEVVFTDAGRTADDEIVARTNAAPPERPVVVVTSDNELRSRVTTLGATVTRSPALLGLATAR